METLLTIDCNCTNLEWVWGPIIRCADCGRRYHSPTEAEELRNEPKYGQK